ncbi:MAG TPA: hypothetical protein VMV94_15965 [Phycisphaerae bacterium]|nr:hypothetical protein [Phycisphaerae bacterium]
MLRKFGILAAVGVSFVLLGGLIAFAQDKGEKGEKKGKEPKEREVKEAEVPPAVMAAAKKAAGTAKIEKFSVEMERGHKYFEATFTGPDGKTDVLISESGEVIEIEEGIPAEKVPAGVKAAVEKEAGKDAKITFEKKTVVMYEAKFTKGDKKHEIMLLPDGTRHGKGAKGEEEEDEDDD